MVFSARIYRKDQLNACTIRRAVLYDSKYLTVFPVASAYSISDRVLAPIYPPTLITNISSAISIFRLCISSSISLVLVRVSSDDANHDIPFQRQPLLLCQKSVLKPRAPAQRDDLVLPDHFYPLKFPYTCRKCTARNTTPTAASSTFRLQSPIAT